MVNADKASILEWFLVVQTSTFQPHSEVSIIQETDSVGTLNTASILEEKSI